MESPNSDFDPPSLRAFEYQFEREGRRCQICLRSIGFRFFRSIGEKTLWWDTNSRISLFIGPNNAGKSNTLRAIERLAKSRVNFNSGELDHQDFFNCSDAQGPLLSYKFSIAVDLNGQINNHYFTFEESEATENLWRFQLVDVPPSYFIELAEGLIKSRDMQSSAIALQEQSDLTRARHERIARGLVVMFLSSFPSVRFIEASQPEAVDGSLLFSDIAHKMSCLRQPLVGKNAEFLRLRFKNMLQMSRVILGRPNLEFEFPVAEAVHSFVVCDGGIRLNIERHGTGFQQIVGLAFKLFESDSPLLLIDEPEVRLHPTLQKKLVEYLISLPDHVSIISTHSPFMLSACSRQEVSLTRLTLDGTGCWTEGQVLDRSHKLLALLRDLGVSASDVLQVRYVIWVEGPSDVIYLRGWLAAWISAYPGELVPVEGIDFAFAFYGGKLLAHVGISDDDGVEGARSLMDLLKLCRQGTVVIDSDKSSEGDQMGAKAMKQRVLDECQKSNSIDCWITAGREIENYVPVKAIERIFGDKLESELTFSDFECIDDALHSAWRCKQSPKRPYGSSKVKYARRIVESLSDDERHPKSWKQDLQSHVSGLVQRIVNAIPR